MDTKTTWRDEEEEEEKALLGRSWFGGGASIVFSRLFACVFRGYQEVGFQVGSGVFFLYFLWGRWWDDWWDGWPWREYE